MKARVNEGNKVTVIRPTLGSCIKLRILEVDILGLILLATNQTSHPSIIEGMEEASRPWQIRLFGERILTKKGEVDTMQALEGKEFIAIYFSAHWCPPCRRFTPTLAAFYDQEQEDDEDVFEVVFASGDHSATDFQEYYSEMPWVAVPFASRSVSQGLSTRFGVMGIPSLIVLDGKTGEIKDSNARSAVGAANGKVAAVIDKWRSNSASPLPEAGGSWLSSCIMS